MDIRKHEKDGKLFYNVSDLLNKVNGTSWDYGEKEWIDRMDVVKLVVLGKGDKCLNVLVELGITEQLAENEFPDIAGLYF